MKGPANRAGQTRKDMGDPETDDDRDQHHRVLEGAHESSREAALIKDLNDAIQRPVQRLVVWCPNRLPTIA